MVKRSAQKPAVSCEAVERFALGPNFCKAQVLVVASAGNKNLEVNCGKYYGVGSTPTLTSTLTPTPYPYLLPLHLHIPYT